MYKKCTLLVMAYTKKIDHQELVACACKLVEQEGVEALSMRRLAQILDVQASSLYNHFADKSALLAEVAERGLYRLAEKLEHASALARPNPRHQIEAMGLTYREWALQHSHIYTLLFMGAPPLEGDAPPSAAATFAPMLAATAQLVGEDQAEAATQAVWAFIHGFVTLELTGHMQRCLPAEGFTLGLTCLVQGLGR
ncbi:TetR family transcriptional regulator [Ktedonobacter robiniae]|uniref:TetR family transcriptional regulator n=2 Tax=Ktedonobacter robiniae TaxID=2778365 RepID=A0ABQ3UYW8_9CHLR|nr:TetR family transcriptional regulator [Ktedonobacter robiniae]